MTASLRRSARSAAALGVVLSLTVAATPALAAAPKVSSHVTARASSAKVTAGGSVVVSGSVTPKVKGLAVRVQRLVGHTWKTVGHGTESRTGSYSIRVTAPSVAGPLFLRAVLPATRAVKAGTSRTLRLRVTAAAYQVTARIMTTPVPSGSPIVVAGRVSPTATGQVTLQRLVGTTWTTMTAEGLVASAYTFLVREPPGTYTLRVVKPKTSHYVQGVSPSLTATVFVSGTVPQPPAFAVTTTTLPAGSTHQPYSAALTASGGTAPYTWRLTGGTLPAGLTLSAAGLLSGTPTAGAAASLTVQVTDAGASTATAVLGLTVALAQGTPLTWGNNANGELGDGLPLGTVIPSTVPGLTGVKQVAMHGKTGYALTNGGGVVAWGAGTIGQLGNGNDVASTAPVGVTGLSSGVVAVAAGSENGYALKSDGTVWAWGLGNDGELGDGGQAASRTPVRVSALTGVKAIAGEDTAGLALKTDGTLWRWGQEYAYVGHGGGDDYHHYTPALVPGLSDQAVIAIGGGAKSGYAVMADHTVRTWGPAVGQSAVAVTGLNDVVAVAAGASTAYALTSGGAVLAWGGGARGQLGDGGTDRASEPEYVAVHADVVGIAANGDSAYAVLADGTVWAWGANDAGQLGDGNSLDALSPVQVSGLSGVTGVAGSAVARHGDGTVSSWGPDLVAYDPRNAPAAVVGITDATSLVEDDMGGVVIRADGTVWDWGDNLRGELGNGSLALNSDAPVQVSGLSQVVAVAGRAGTRYALRADGSVWAWGANNNGDFGSSSPPQSSTPVHVPGIDHVTAITAATDTAFALRSDGTVWAWGYNGLGSLGDGDNHDRATPEPIAGLSHITSVVAAEWTIYAITDDGHVWGWGDAFEQQLDPTIQTESDVPILLNTISQVKAMATTGGTAYAVLTDGSVVWWGFNPFSVIDDSQPFYQGTPHPVPGVAGATAVAATEFGGAALLRTGTVVTWGTNRPGYRGWDAISWAQAAQPVAGLTGVTSIWAGGEETGVLRTG